MFAPSKSWRPWFSLLLSLWRLFMSETSQTTYLTAVQPGKWCTAACFPRRVVLEFSLHWVVVGAREVHGNRSSCMPSCSGLVQRKRSTLSKSAAAVSYAEFVLQSWRFSPRFYKVLSGLPDGQRAAIRPKVVLGRLFMVWSHIHSDIQPKVRQEAATWQAVYVKSRLTALVKLNSWRVFEPKRFEPSLASHPKRSG